MSTKLAIIGLGKMGLMHASIFGMMDNVEIVAMCEKNSFVRRFGKKVLQGITLVSDIGDLFGMELDAVCITTPPASHYSLIKTIYTTGIARNIFVEKPLATDSAHAKDICRLASTCGGVNMVGYHLRRSVTFRKARQILDEGVLGDIVSFDGYAYSADFLGAKSAKPALGRGGVLEDSGCHVIDLALWMLGPIEVEKAEIASILSNGSQDEVSFDGRTQNGQKGHFSVSWCKEGYRLPEMGLTVKGALGTVAVNQDEVNLELNGKPASLWYKHDLCDYVPFSIGGNEYQRQDELFIHAIRDGISIEPCFETASKVQKLIDQVYDHAK